MRILALLALVTLAGCMAETPVALTLDATTYTITTTGVPTAAVAPGSTFQVIVKVAGSVESMTDHAGAHFGKNSTATPSTSVYTSTCTHSGGKLPQTFTATCKAPQTAGVYHLRGHARVTKDNVTTNWWGADETFTVG